MTNTTDRPDPAVERAKQLAEESINLNVPQAALDYWGFWVRDLGPGRKTRLLAFAHYAQAAEGLACADPLYRIDSAGVEWFKANGGAR